jgi:hypothetical protein
MPFHVSNETVRYYPPAPKVPPETFTVRVTMQKNRTPTPKMSKLALIMDIE